MQPITNISWWRDIAACVEKELQPPAPLEPQDWQDGAQRDERQAELVTPRPVKLRHVFEVHSIDARYEGWWNANDRYDRQDSKDVILLGIDKAQDSIEQKLRIPGQMGFVVCQGY